MNQIRGIAISGLAGSGKTTVADLFVQKLHNHNWESKRIALADPIKEIYGEYFIASPTKPRVAYQTIGQAFRAIDENVWIRALQRTVTQRYVGYVIVTDDMRMPNEYEYFVSQGYFTIRVVVPDDALRIGRLVLRDKSVDLDALNHVTETSLNDKMFDFTIVNNGDIDNLKTQIDAIYLRMIDDMQYHNAPILNKAVM